jgi:hypothetical protein
MASRSRRVDQHRRETLHPPEQRDVIHVDAALREQLLEVADDSPKRRYQPTANMITSGGNRKPANAESSTECVGE